MDQSMITTILWGAAVAVLLLYVLRRKGRKTNAFK